MPVLGSLHITILNSTLIHILALGFLSFVLSMILTPIYTTAMAGIILVVSVALVTLTINLQRSETWLPLAGMIAAGVVGLVDDLINIRGTNGIAGMRAKTKFLLYSIIALVEGWWFYSKLGVTHVYIPGFHEIYIGIFVILLF